MILKLGKFILKLKNYEKVILFIPIFFYPLAILFTYFKYLFFNVNILLFFNISQIVLLSFPTFMYLIFIFYIGFLFYEIFIYLWEEIYKLSKKNKMIFFLLALLVVPLLYRFFFASLLNDLLVRFFFLHSFFISVLLLIFKILRAVMKDNYKISFYIFSFCTIYISFFIFVTYFSLLRQHSPNNCEIRISDKKLKRNIILNNDNFLFLYDKETQITSLQKKEFVNTIFCK